MGQTGAGEDGQLLTANQSVQSVNGRNAGLNELGGVVPGCGVHGQTVDVHIGVGENVRATVDGIAHAVEYTAQHILGNAQLQGMTQEANLALGQVDTGGGVKQLNQRVRPVNLQYLAQAAFSAWQLDLTQLVIGDALYIFHQHQRSGNLGDGAIFLNHSPGHLPLR